MRRTVLPLLIIAIVAVCGLIGASTAWADGDPASDILVTQSLFMPWDADISTQAQAQLAATIAAADRAGFPVKVALISSGADLGAYPQLFGNPGGYVRFLGTELSELWDGQLLVVMPGGFGLYGPGSGPHTVGSKEAAVTAPTPGTGDHMAQSATLVVERLAAADGHSFAPSTVTTKTPAASTGGSHWVTWLTLVLGALAILFAWGASLRARPRQWRRRAQA